ncbi:MAG: serine protease [Solirubrobacterales bacterium]|nr:serine protease [Solirubrobacterales bacterium]
MTGFAAFAVCLTICLPSAAMGANGRSALAGSVPPWATASRLKAAATSSDQVGFRVYLGWRNPAQAEALAQAVSNPASGSYGKFLSPGQFQSQFAPSQSDVSAVRSWLQGAGFSIVYTPTNNHYVAAEGTVAQVQSAFATQLNEYAVDGQTLRAPASELTIPSSLASTVAGVLGIDQSATLVRPLSSPEPAAPPSAGFRNAPPCSTYWNEKNTANTQVSDPARGIGNVSLPNYAGLARPFAPCGYAGSQLQSAYGVKSAIASGTDGRGVTVAVIDAYASPTIESDANTYFSRHGLPRFSAGQFSQVAAPGTYRRPENPRQDPQGWYGEETLDVEAVHTTAPGAKVVYVGAPNNYQDLDAALNHVVERHLADIVTNSYGFSSEFLPRGYIKPYNDTFLQAVAEGIGVYFSAGDNGDETFGGDPATATADWPASSPWVTAVGGTSLAVGQGDSYLFETGWGTNRNRINCTGFLKAIGNAWCTSESYLYGSGGGTSRLFAEPSYQQGVVPASLANRWIGQTGRSGRVVPDISAVGDPNTGMLVGQTQTFTNGTSYDEYRIGGTSLSSPLMAGIMAVGQQARGSQIGFANPLIYGLPAGAFHDIVDPASTVAAVRADYANSENGSDGILYSIRKMNVTFTLHTIPGYDDVTGRGTPNDAFLGAVAAATP